MKQNSKVSTSSPAIVEPMVLVQSHLPFVIIFILARINELINSPPKYAIREAPTILGVWPSITRYELCKSHPGAGFNIPISHNTEDINSAQKNPTHIAFLAFLYP